MGVKQDLCIYEQSLKFKRLAWKSYGYIYILTVTPVSSPHSLTSHRIPEGQVDAGSLAAGRLRSLEDQLTRAKQKIHSFQKLTGDGEVFVFVFVFFVVVQQQHWHRSGKHKRMELRVHGRRGGQHNDRVENPCLGAGGGGGTESAQGYRMCPATLFRTIYIAVR